MDVLLEQARAASDAGVESADNLLWENAIMTTMMVGFYGMGS